MGRLDPAKVIRELTVGEVAERSGLAVSALHFYETRGLIRSSRSAGNQRRYPRSILRRIAIIKAAQKAGIPLQEIAEALSALPQDRPVSVSDWERLSAVWRDQLDDRITRLVKLRDQMSHCIGCGCLSLQECPLRNPLDELSERGPGPQLLDPS